MKKLALLLLALWPCKDYFSQDLSNNYAKYIDTADLHRHLSVLVSDEFAGRKTGTKGQLLTAKYIRDQFRNMNVSAAPQDGSVVTGKKYMQPYELLEKVKSGKLRIDRKTLYYPEDFGFNGLYQPLKFECSVHTVVSVKDLLDPQEDFSEEILLVEIEDYKSFNREMVSRVKCLGIIFLVNNYDPRYFTDYSTDNLAMIQDEVKPPYLFVNRKSVGKFVVGHAFNEKRIRVELNSRPKYVSTSNVLGFVEGSDPELKKEIIVISAHHDHIGMENGKIFNGADDNGSGTSGLLEIAQAFQQAKKEGKNPKRSILFLSVSGEEMGLFGSSHYASHPVFPLENTITDLNIDMIGRTTKPSEKDTFSVYVIGSNMLSDELHEIQEQANKQFTHLDLDYKYNDVNEPLKLYYRSDHYNFAKKGIPSIFYFGGFHDDYHKETDDIEKINFEKIRQISVLVFHTAWMLGNAEKRPGVNH